MYLKYFNEFRSYLREVDIKPIRPSDRAKILFGFNNKKIKYILTNLNISEDKQEAIKMVANGKSYIEVSRMYNCSPDTIRKWINKTYMEVCNYE